MIESLQETRHHIQQTKQGDIHKEKIKRYRVDQLLNFLGWPITSDDRELTISFNKNVKVERFDYHLRNKDGFIILVEVLTSSELQDTNRKSEELENYGKSLILSTDGIDYVASFYTDGEITELFSSNVLKDSSRWFLNFIGSESVRNGQTEKYAKELASIERDREAIKESIEQSVMNLESVQLPDNSLSNFQDRLEERLDDKIDRIRSEFSGAFYGGSREYDFQDVVDQFNELVLVVSKGGLGIDDYVGTGGTWCSENLSGSDPSYLAVSDPNSECIRYALDVEEVMAREEFERTKNTDLSDTEWYESGEKLIKISKIYPLTDPYILSEEYGDSEIPVTVSPSELIRSDVKF